MSRENWRSRFGFIWAAVGSAVGLGNIWRFPYIVGESGGGAFLIVYLICLALIGIPVLVSEILIGRRSQRSPADAFDRLGRSKGWRGLGFITIITGFLVSGFYCVVCGWTLSYLVDAIFGRLTHFAHGSETLAHFQSVTTSPFWALFYLILFMILCLWILTSGVQKGIESSNKVIMPLLFVILAILVVRGLFLQGASQGIAFIFQCDFAKITPKICLMALGQAFFALSLGQGTMVTYGSYLPKKENISTVAFPIAFFSTCVSILAGLAIFTIVFSEGIAPQSGEGLMFETLPLIFSKLPGGYFFALAFFGLLFMAGITSEISAMEPLIAYFIDKYRWKRRSAVLLTTLLTLTVGLICALSFGPWKGVTLFGLSAFSGLSSLCVNILIPIGGLFAVLLVGWRLGWKVSFEELKQASSDFYGRYPFLKGYYAVTIRFLAPLIILLIMVNNLII